MDKVRPTGQQFEQLPNVGLFWLMYSLLYNTAIHECPKCRERKQLESSAWGIPLWGTLPETPLSRLFHPPTSGGLILSQCIDHHLKWNRPAFMHTPPISPSFHHYYYHQMLVFLFPISPYLSISFYRSYPWFSGHGSLMFFLGKDTHKHWAAGLHISIEIQEMDYIVLLRKII